MIKIYTYNTYIFIDVCTRINCERYNTTWMRNWQARFYEVQDVNRILLVPTGCDARVTARMGENRVRASVCVCVCV